MQLLATLVLGVFFIIGVIIVKESKNKELIEHWSIALSLGALVALALFDILPEVIEGFEIINPYSSVVFVLAGMFILLALDKFIPDHNHSDHEDTQENYAHIGIMAALCIIIHNIVEGMSVYTLIGESLVGGITLTIGIGLHNIPMGMLIYSTLQNERKDKKNYILAFSALSTFFGGMIMYVIEDSIPEKIVSMLISIALGMVFYIVMFELFPSVKHSHDKKSKLWGVIIGFVVVFLSVKFLG